MCVCAVQQVLHLSFCPGCSAGCVRLSVDVCSSFLLSSYWSCRGGFYTLHNREYACVTPSREQVRLSFTVSMAAC